MDWPSEVLRLVESRSPTLGAGRLICIDGPAGSGKTTLAAGIAALTDACVIHMDDLYPGWEGLPQVAEQLTDLLCPLSNGVAGSYRRFDWDQDAYAETVSVAPTGLLVLEGVGSGARVIADLITTLVWVETNDTERLRRGLARDGEVARDKWLAWMESEAAWFATEQTSARADLHFDTSAPPAS